MQLGLIGIGITHSRSPDLHRRLGELTGIKTSYDILEVGDASSFDLSGRLRQLREAGYRGVNITYPFKERALALADRIGEGPRRVGSTNTLIFDAEGIRAENTDYTGFMSAWRYNFGQRSPGGVVQIGAGGVGRAVAHGLSSAGADWIAIVDTDPDRAERLAGELRALGNDAQRADTAQLPVLMAGAAGLVNCSPIGHLDHPGCPLDCTLLRPGQWLFDAVYVPAETELLRAAHRRELTVLSGIDLFVFQGVDAFRFFAAKHDLDERIMAQAPQLRAHYHRELIGAAPA